MASPKTPKASVYQPGFLDNNRDIKPSVERELKRISEAFRLVGSGGGTGGSGGLPSGLSVKYNPNGTATYTYPDPNSGQPVSVVVPINGQDNLVAGSTVVDKAIQDILDLAKELVDEANDRIAQDTLMANQLATEAKLRADNDAILAQNIITGLTNEETARTAAISAESQARVNAINTEVANRQQAIATNENLWRTEISNQKTYIDNANSHLVDMISNISAGTGEAFDPANIWYFDTTVQGWTSNPGTISVDADGWLHPDSGSATVDAVLESPSATNDPTNWTDFSPAAYRYLRMRIKKVGNPTWKGEIGWRTATDTGFPAANVKTIPEPAASAWDANGVTTIDISDIPWNAVAGGKIDQIKIDLTGPSDSSNIILYDWIAIGRPTPGAGMAALQNESMARQAGDQAEAVSRQTLVTNLIGSSYGLNPGETGPLPDSTSTTGGIIFSERQLWKKGDSDEAAARESLRVATEASIGTINTELHTLTTKTDANATDITSLQTTVNGDPSDPTSGLSNIVTTLSSDVTKNKSDIASNTAQLQQLTASINNNSGVNLFPGGTFESFNDDDQVNLPLSSGQPNKWLVAKDSSKFVGNRGAIATRGAPDTDQMNEMLVGTRQTGRRGAYYYAEVYVAKNPASTQQTGILKFGIKSYSADGTTAATDGIDIDVSTLTTAFQKIHGYFQCSYFPDLTDSNATPVKNPRKEITEIQPVFWFPKANNSAGVSVMIDNAFIITANGEAAADANAQATALLDSKVTQQAGQISTITSDTTTLKNDVDGLKTGKAEQSAVDSLTQKVETNEQGLSTVQAQYTQLDTRVGSAETSVGDLIAKGDSYIMNGTFPNDYHDWSFTSGVTWAANDGDGKSGFTMVRDSTNTSPTLTSSRVPASSGRYFRAVVRMKSTVADTIVTVRNNFTTSTSVAPFDAYDRQIKVGTAWEDYDITWHAGIDGSGADKASPDDTSYLFLSLINGMTDSEVSVSSIYLYDDTGSIANTATAHALETLTNEVHDTNTGLSSTSQKLINLSNQVVTDSRLKDASGPNLFPDGTFESYAVGNLPNTSNNTYTQIVLKSSTPTQEPQPHFGSKCLRFTRPGNVGGSTHTDVYFGAASVINPTTGAVTKEERYFTSRSGSSYTVEAWVKPITVPASGGVTLRIGIHSKLSDNTDQHLGAIDFHIDSSTSVGTWTKLSKQVTIDPKSVQSRIYMTTISDNNQAGASAVFLIDDIYVSDSTDAKSAGAGNAAAIQDLTTKVDAANGRIDTQSDSITSLTAQVTGARGDTTNMLLNGDFSSVKPGDFWSYPSGATFPVDDATRMVCAQLPSNTAALAVSQRSRIKAGRTYRVSCLYKFSDTAVITAAGDTKLALSTVTPYVLLGTAPFTKSAGTQSWQPARFEYTATADADVDIAARAFLSAGVIRLDNFRFEDVTETNATLSANAGAISQLGARVTSSEGKIQANTSSITRLESNIGQSSLEAVYNWEFDKNSDFTDWVLSNGTLTKGPSKAIIKPTTIDPQYTNSHINFVGGIYNTVKFRMRTSSGTIPQNSKSELYWSTANHGYSDTYKCRFDLSGLTTTWKIFSLDMTIPGVDLTNAASADWLANTITGIRFDPAIALTPSVEIDFITIGKVGNTGSVSAINTITTHLESSDEAIAAAQLAQAEGFNQQRAQIGANDTKITITQTSIADLDRSMSSRIVALDAKTDTTNANVTNLTKVVADKDTALGQRVDSLTATVNANNKTLTASVATAQSTAASANGKVEAKWGVVASTVGKNGRKIVTGISLGSGASTGYVTIQADRFQIWNATGSSSVNADAVAPFRVEDNTVFIDTAMIKNGTITTAQIGNAKIGNAQISGTLSSQSNASGKGWSLAQDGTLTCTGARISGDLTGSNGTFSGTVAAERIVGDIVNMHTFSGGKFRVSAGDGYDHYRQVTVAGNLPFPAIITVPTFIAWNDDLNYDHEAVAYIRIGGTDVAAIGLSLKASLGVTGKQQNLYIPLSGYYKMATRAKNVVVRVGIRGRGNSNVSPLHMLPSTVFVCKENSGSFTGASESPTG